MSTSRSPMQDENANTRVVGANGRDELSNYAEDALKEVLGWYGLREGTEGTPTSTTSLANGKNHMTKMIVTAPSSTVLPVGHKATQKVTTQGDVQESDIADKKMQVKANSVSILNAKNTSVAPSGGKVANPIDLTNGHNTSSELANTDGSTSVKSSHVGHRKLIGMRFLFPPLSDEMPLMERAKIWVRRHDYKYFVGWTEEELKSVDPILRPINTITPELYKLHMNRSEYCRNVKLKYCLEADTDWAKEFREKVKKPASEGGFTGLCQAKIAAAELWRKYSEKYRSHQARYPNPKSRYKLKSQNCNTGNDEDEANSKRKTSGDEEAEDDGTENNQESKRVRFDDDMDMACEEEEDNMDLSRINYESDECHEMDDVEYSQKYTQMPERPVSPTSEEKDSQKAKVTSSRDIDNKQIHVEEKAVYAIDSNSHESPMISTGGSSDLLTSHAFLPRLATAPFFGVPFPLYPTGVAHFTAIGASGEHPPDGANLSKVGITAAETVSSGSMTTTSTGFTKPRQSDRHEYKRSERGLSYLFPSLSDHNLSLIDKVRITVIRHKNNYFLGKTEEELSRIDPLIRPKMVVTPEIYKEYCHRNAMKYDSNLQFAMESPEPWAEEFRAKLMRPPSEGGFSSLCEVKLEAGRLWREFSGKYRMHNIVKWQMDLNSTTKGIKPDPDEVVEQTRSLPQRMVGSSQEPTSPSETSDQDGSVLPGSYKVPSPQSSVESMDMQFVGARTACSTDVVNPSRPDSSDVTSPRTSALEQAAVSGILDLHVEPSLGKSSASKHDVSNQDLQPDSSQDLSPKRQLSSPKVVRRHLGGSRDATTEYYQHYTPAHHLSYQLHTHNVSDASADKNSASDLSRTYSDIGSADALFKHLPRTMSVAQQLSIWLERYRHNFFLGYSKEELANLGEYLRPNMLVTKDVFNKYVPESMVDIISKIELIMVSSEPWAIAFQEKIHRSPKDGGFAKFEDAITDAVMLWNLMKMSDRVQSVWSEDRGKAVPFSRQHPEMPLDLHHSEICLVKSESPGGGYCSQGKHDKYNSESCVQAKATAQPEQVSEKQDETTGTVHGQLLARSPRQDQTGVPSEDTFVGQRFEDHTSLGLFSLLWALRDRLHLECADDPRTSWADRLEAHLPTLRAVLGPSYVIPVTTTSCIIDLVLCMLHQHVQHIANLAPPTGRDLSCKKQDVITETNS